MAGHPGADEIRAEAAERPQRRLRPSITAVQHDEPRHAAPEEGREHLSVDPLVRVLGILAVEADANGVVDDVAVTDEVDDVPALGVDPIVEPIRRDFALEHRVLDGVSELAHRQVEAVELLLDVELRPLRDDDQHPQRQRLPRGDFARVDGRSVADEDVARVIQEEAEPARFFVEALPREVAQLRRQVEAEDELDRVVTRGLLELLPFEQEAVAHISVEEGSEENRPHLAEVVVGHARVADRLDDLVQPGGRIQVEVKGSRDGRQGPVRRQAHRVTVACRCEREAECPRKHSRPREARKSRATCTSVGRGSKGNTQGTTGQRMRRPKPCVR